MRVNKAAVVREAQAAVAARIEHEQEYGESQVTTDLVEVLRTVRFWWSSDRELVANVADTRWGRTFSYVAGDALDNLPSLAPLFDQLRIDRLGATSWSIAW